MRSAFRRGYIDLSRVKAYIFDDDRTAKRTVRVHWTLLLGYVAVGGFQLAYWRWVGFTLLVLAHITGHVFAASRARILVRSVDVTLLGGLCHSASASWRRKGVVAVSGILAQALVFLAASAWILLLRPPYDSAIRDVLWVWIVPNGIMAGANLLPIPTSDGPRLLLFIRQLRAARAVESLRKATHAASRSVDESDAAFARSQEYVDALADDILAQFRKDNQD